MTFEMAQLMKHKVAELEGALLDAAVAKADEVLVVYVEYCPSENWSQGGPIIECEQIEVGPSERDGQWFACLPKSPRDFNVGAWGATPLIAAMRAYCASKFGDEVEL
jgi:hypothetical protein